MAFQLVTALTNVLLLILKIVAYVLVRKSFLLMMVIDNLADMLFSLLLCIPDSKYYSKKFSKVVCCRLMQLSQSVPVLMFIADMQKVSKLSKRAFLPYLVSIIILALQLLAKTVLYGLFKRKNFSKTSSDYLLLQDQIYDIVCTLPGLLSLLLIISLQESSEVIIDYITTVFLFAITISFWERTLIKVNKPKLESLHPTFSKRVGDGQSVNNQNDPPSNNRSENSTPRESVRRSAEIALESQVHNTPSPQFEKKTKDSEVDKVVEMV